MPASRESRVRYWLRCLSSNPCHAMSQKNIKTAETNAAQMLPMAALDAYLYANLPGWSGLIAAEKFSGGQSNPTYKLETATQTLVLRRKPPGTLLPSAHAVDREYRVLKALHGQGVPVAQPILLCLDESVLGSMFYLMEYLPGRIFWNPALPEQDASDRSAIYFEIAEVLAALHRVNPNEVGLADYGRPGDYFQRQLNRWQQQFSQSELVPMPEMHALHQALMANAPLDDGQVALVHGDFRIDNLIFHPSELRVQAVVDWELSTLGHPIADAAYFAMALRLPRNPALPGLAGLNRTELGIPSEEVWLQRYLSGAKLRNADALIERWPWYLAFNFYRLAAIAQGVKKRATLGNASHARANEVGEMVGMLAGLGLAQLKLG